MYVHVIMYIHERGREKESEVVVISGTEKPAGRVGACTYLLSFFNIGFPLFFTLLITPMPYHSLHHLFMITKISLSLPLSLSSPLKIGETLGGYRDKINFLCYEFNTIFKGSFSFEGNVVWLEDSLLMLLHTDLSILINC